MNFQKASCPLCRGTGKTRNREASMGVVRDHDAHRPGCGCVWDDCPRPHITVEIPATGADGTPAAVVIHLDPDRVTRRGWNIETR